MAGKSPCSLSGRCSMNHLIRLTTHANSRSDSEQLPQPFCENTRSPCGEIFPDPDWPLLQLVSDMNGSGSNLWLACDVSATMVVHHPSFPGFRFWKPASRPHFSPAVLARSAMIFGAIFFCTMARSDESSSTDDSSRIWQFPLLVSTTTAAYFWLIRNAIALATSSKNNHGCLVCG